MFDVNELLGEGISQLNPKKGGDTPIQEDIETVKLIYHWLRSVDDVTARQRMKDNKATPEF